MEIYRTGNRLFLVLTVTPEYSFETKAKADKDNPKVQAWEALMNTFQQPLPDTRPDEKWQLMERIFHLQGCE